MSSSIDKITNCWSRIGVWRQDEEVCPKLAEVIHCRNCTTYIDAGLILLDRELPDNYAEDYLKTSQINTQQDDDNATSCLIFRVNNEWYALKASVLSEISEITVRHSIPHNRNSIMDGLVNIRGEMEICISFPNLTGNAKNDISAKGSNKARIIIIKLVSGKYAFQVDEVMGIMKINDHTIKQPPASLSKSNSVLCQGIFDYNQENIGLVDELRMDNILVESLS